MKVIVATRGIEYLLPGQSQLYFLFGNTAQVCFPWCLDTVMWYDLLSVLRILRESIFGEFDARELNFLRKKETQFSLWFWATLYSKFYLDNKLYWGRKSLRCIGTFCSVVDFKGYSGCSRKIDGCPKMLSQGPCAACRSRPTTTILRQRRH